MVMAKPLADAFYEQESVKYLYMLLLLSGALFAKYGQAIQWTKPDPRNRSLLALIWLVILYFVFQLVLALTYGGSLSEIFKIISPFVFFVLVSYAADRWLNHALAIGSALTIMANALLLPFDYGWAMWGSVHTFKGYYFFKTDLAYALSFSVLMYAFYSRYRTTRTLVLLTLIAAVQVMLANSRLNYLSFFCVVMFMAIKGGVSQRTIVKYSLLLSIVAAVTFVFYDPTRMLSFDISNEAAFTQGRSVTWKHLLEAQGDSSLAQWTFGRGAFADLILSADFSGIGKTAHNAHNEALHLLFTQGICGAVLYIALWVKMFRMSHTSNMPTWVHGTGALALFIFMLQGMTAVVSSYASKTWPLVMILLALRTLGCRENERKQVDTDLI